MGYLRLVLALIVMQAHATPPGAHYAFAHTAVLIFFAISGYGCTKAMQGPYKGQPLQFLAGRYIRLWPGYLAIFGMASVLWLLMPELPNMGFPTGWAWLKELLMVRRHPVLVPVGWMLPCLLMGYIAIALGVSKTPQRTAWWLLLSFATSQHQAILGWGAYYGGWGAWSLAYSVGSAIAWMPIEIPNTKGWASEMAFPVFLSHYLILAILQWRGISPGWPLFFAALAPTLALSWLLVVAVERPVQRFRSSLKKNNAPNTISIGGIAGRGYESSDDSNSDHLPLC